MNLFFLLVLVLPAVIDTKRCCLPGKFQGLFYDTDTQSGSSFVADLTGSSKLIVRPFNHPNIDFKLTDYKAGWEYTQNKDHTCTKAQVEAFSLLRCIPRTATNVGTFYLGPNNFLDISTWRYVQGIHNVTLGVFPDTCMPVIMHKQFLGEYSTRIFSNMTKNVPDLSDLIHETSHCKEEV